ncbi:hypothetical protein [Actinophytocola xanthii]|uniref:Uncharacterized protein n=1 Tax=Actinophytocola xanthii TaxID=1912961 RepID=A0A1Q8CS15_9PSEU|nr:hypothetical protein [Actinophytocola xanthii]OLF17151.1 hypothetical protein BU204_12915 [Actinophytocola xanthii]
MRDDTTRYLCAAAHEDSTFANQAIREFLVEDTRPVPPAPGVDAPAVLGEAIAARTRRKLRDSALLALFLAFAVLAPLDLLLYWVVLAVLFSIGAITRARKDAELRTEISNGGPAVLATIVISAVFLYLLYDYLASSPGGAGVPPGYYPYPVEPDSALPVALGTSALVAAMLVVLLWDRLVVWRHLRDRFWPNHLGGAVPPLPDRSVFRLSPERFTNQLWRHHNNAPTMAPPTGNGSAGVPMTVYRGFEPFVGAGLRHEPWSIAVPLERIPDVEPTISLGTDTLYAAIQREVGSLREASTLAPGRRLRALALVEQVVVAADELVDHLHEPESSLFLAHPGAAPYTALSAARVGSLRMEPLEWARYYHCYQVETWDRDLVVSVFVHVAVGAGALYVEWTPCLLLPIRKRYQDIDRRSRSPLRAVGQAVLDVLRLPATVPERLVHLLTFIRPLPHAPGAVNPDRYGTAKSLRELAADRNVHNYFQLADVDRYLKTMESRLILAVGRTMREAGYSPASFEEQAATVVNNNVQIAGSVGGSVVAGTGNRIRTTPAPRATEQAGKAR